MAIRVVRLGMPRAAGEGVRLGTVRRPPRGVPKRDFARRDFYDVWLPELSPSAPTVSGALAEPWTPARWRRFERIYLKERACYARLRRAARYRTAGPPLPGSLLGGPL